MISRKWKPPCPRSLKHVRQWRRTCYKQARMSAERAELDARLAEARVLTLKSQEQVNQLNTRLNRLRKQLGEAQ